MAVTDLVWITSLWSSLAGYAVLILGGLAFLWIWLFRDLREKALSRAASGLGLQFSPKVSPDELGIRGASFYEAGAPRNCMRGMIAGRETVIFDLTMPSGPASRPHGDGSIEATVVGFCVPPNSYCRGRGVNQPSRWHVEKMGEWVFVFHCRPLVRPGNVEAYVEEARGWLEKAIDPNGYEPTLLAGVLG